MTLTKELLRAHRYDQARHWLLSREEDWAPSPELYWDFLHFLGASPGCVVLDEAPEEKLTPEVKPAPASLFCKGICAAEAWQADVLRCAFAHLAAEGTVQSRSSTSRHPRCAAACLGRCCCAAAHSVASWCPTAACLPWQTYIMQHIVAFFSKSSRVAQQRRG